jgi:hypothetical protein
LHDWVNIGAYKGNATKFTIPGGLSTWLMEKYKATICDLILFIAQQAV